MDIQKEIQEKIVVLNWLREARKSIRIPHIDSYGYKDIDDIEVTVKDKLVIIK